MPSNPPITDFNEPVLVADRHRDYRASIIVIAQGHANDIAAATTITELLVVFDAIAGQLE